MPSQPDTTKHAPRLRVPRELTSCGVVECAQVRRVAFQAKYCEPRRTDQSLLNSAFYALGGNEKCYSRRGCIGTWERLPAALSLKIETHSQLSSELREAWRASTATSGATSQIVHFLGAIKPWAPPRVPTAAEDPQAASARKLWNDACQQHVQAALHRD